MPAVDIAKTIAEAKSMGLFTPYGAFEVHCRVCHTRLDPHGDCPSCGAIGRSQAEIEKRALTDPAGTEKLLERQIAKRRSYKPVKT